MRPPAPRPKLRKREIALALGAGALASLAAAGILSDGFGGPGSSFDPEVALEAEDTARTYQVGEFDRISTQGPQDIQISYGDGFSVRSEGPSGQLEVSVVDGELVIAPRGGGFGPNWQRLRGATFFVTLPRLDRLTLNGSGDIHVEQLRTDRFVGVIEGGFSGSFEVDAIEVDDAEFTINGPGEVTASGLARSTRVTINGPGEFKAGDLRSQLAVIAVNGPGDVELAVEREADVSVRGPGEVDIDGPARCSISTSGPGSVSCGGGED